MNNMEISSLVASIVSVIVAFLAIYLSVTFYKMSTKISQDVKNKTDTIEKSVDKLEKVSDILYQEIIAILKDTVADIRKHAWEAKPYETLERLDQETNKKVEKIKREVKEEMEAQISKTIKRSDTDVKIEELQKNIKQILDRAIDESRHVEKTAFTEILMADILKSLRRLDKIVPLIKAKYVVEELPGFNLEDIRDGIIQLRDERFIKLPKYVKDKRDIVPETAIALRHKA
jgi:hypothetical protein